MRTAKSLWYLRGVVGLLVGLALVCRESTVMAQLPAPNPLVAPLPRPAAPALLTVPGQALAAPSLAPVPTPSTAAPAPAARAFNCSCFGPGEGTRWMGQVSAGGYFAARQAATGACLAYNEHKEPAPALIQDHPETQFGRNALLPPGFTNPTSGTSAGETSSSGTSPAALPGGLTVSSAAQREACAQCICD